jgi:hypothetical protein
MQAEFYMFIIFMKSRAPVLLDATRASVWVIGRAGGDRDQVLSICAEAAGLAICDPSSPRAGETANFFGG